MRQWGANMNTRAGYRMGLLRPLRPLITPMPGAEKSPFQISANLLEVDENVKFENTLAMK